MILIIMIQFEEVCIAETQIFIWIHFVPYQFIQTRYIGENKMTCNM